MDVLLGLDMLKRHQCCIDLKKNVLYIGSANHSTSFLSEHELPAHARLGARGGMSPNRPYVIDIAHERLKCVLPCSDTSAPAPAGGSVGMSTATSATGSGASSDAVPSPTVSNGANDPKIRRLMEVRSAIAFLLCA